MPIKLFDSELRVMDVLWREGDTSAKQIAKTLDTQIGWSKTTTYTIIKRCIDKGAIARLEPGFVCQALITVEEAREYETTELINKMYSGAADQLVLSLLSSKTLSDDEIARLKRIVSELE